MKTEWEGPMTKEDQAVFDWLDEIEPEDMTEAARRIRERKEAEEKDE